MLQHSDQLVLVDHLAARGVDDDGVRAQGAQAAGREQMVGRGRMRNVDRDDVHARQHLVERFPPRHVQLLLLMLGEAGAVVIVDRQAERLGAARDGVADVAHADDAEALAGDAAAQHPGRRPAGPFARGHDFRAFDDAARDGHDQRHGHVGGVVGQNAGRVGDGDAPAQRRGDVDIVDAGAEIGDQMQLLARLRDHMGVDAVGDGGDQHVGGLHRLDDLLRRHRRIVEIEAHVEQFAHARLDALGELAGDHNDRLLPGHSRSISRPAAAPRACGLHHPLTTFGRQERLPRRAVARTAPPSCIRAARAPEADERHSPRRARSPARPW